MVHRWKIQLWLSHAVLPQDSPAPGSIWSNPPVNRLSSPTTVLGRASKVLGRARDQG